MNSDGTYFRLITSGLNRASFSPDGSKIVFQSFNFGLPTLYKSNSDGTSRVQISQLGEGSLPVWQPIRNPRRVSFDFDGDERADVSVFRPAERIWYLLGSQAGFSATQFGLADDKLVPADYDGDIKTDLAVYRNGVWYVLRSSDFGVNIAQFGISNDVPTPADYDGDGKADLAVFRDGVWYILQTSNGNAGILPFGLTADKPLPASYIP